MSSLRIALVITELEFGGAEQCLVRLATGLDRARFEPVVYSLQPLPAAGQDQLVQALAAERIPVHSLEARSLWHAVSACRKLADLLRQQRPQLLQAFLFHANVVGSLAARRAGVPQVLLGVRVADPSWWRGALERSLAARAAGVVCVSQAVADYCRSRHKFPAGKLVVVPNGIEVSRLASTPLADLRRFGVAPDRRTLAFIGRLERQKDPLWLLEVAEAALPQLPHHDLVVVGDGPLKPELQRQIASSPLAGRIHLAGWREDAVQILAAADLLLLTSEHEGMPNVILEAMALGKPVLATPAEGVRELLGPAADEQTAPWRDTGAFVSRLVALARDPVRCAELGASNRTRAAQHYSLEGMINAYQQLYWGLCGS